MMTPENLSKLLSTELLARLRDERFFGSVTLSFRDGRLVLTRVEQTATPQNDGGPDNDKRYRQHR